MDWLKNFFIPSKENGYRPNSLERRSGAIIVLLVIITFGFSHTQTLFTQSSEWFRASIISAALVDLTNGERSGEALTTLKRSPVLDRAAQLKAEDMAGKGYFAHESPEGRTPWYWFKQVGYGYTYAGENLAINFSDSINVVDAWMNSPGHRANIMKSEYREIGIGIAKGNYKGASTIFVVQLFGTPQSQFIAAKKLTSDRGPQEKRINPIHSALTKEKLGSSSQVLPASTEVVAPPHEVFLPKEPQEMITHSKSMVFSDFATTVAEQGVQPVNLPETESVPDTKVSAQHSFVWRFLTSPSTVLNVIYICLSLFIALSLICAIVFEWRRQHLIQIFYGIGLLAIIGVMLYIHLVLTPGTNIR